ncbi:MAG: NUDIX domain-containing protein [Phycisphaerales bacterium]|nr:NUDIX domain-containing protein [Phycisphaerales bacterium]
MVLPVTYGVVAVILRAGRFLLIRRAPQVVVPDAWCFVGGAIEAGESQPEALVRECWEEIGAQIRPRAPLWEYVRPDGQLHLYWWRTDLLCDDLRHNPREVAEVRWCTLTEAEALPRLLESNRTFLSQYGRGLVDHSPI